jgi:hypothetical protein
MKPVIYRLLDRRAIVIDLAFLLTTREAHLTDNRQRAQRNNPTREAHLTDNRQRAKRNQPNSQTPIRG